MGRRRGESPFVDTIVAVADTASWYCALLLLALILVSSLRQQNGGMELVDASSSLHGGFGTGGGGRFVRRPCDEIYVVREGETLHTISDKCGDPFIVERNPHIHDPDDVFPGLVIKITPSPDAFRK